MQAINSNLDNLVFLIFIARISFLSLAEKIILYKKIENLNAAALLPIEEISSLCNRNIRVKNWNGKENLRHAVYEAQIMSYKKIKYLLYSDSSYPFLLKQIQDAPFMIFYKGDISVLQGNTVSVVGTRTLAPECRKAAMNFAYEAVLDGCNIVSGLAYGADSAAHTGAVNAFFDAQNSKKIGKTAAVMPCGCDTVVPYSNRKLAERILCSGGCILSEYVPGVPAAKWRYVHRNRIIAALSPATVVIQAGAGSGSLITAQYALDYNRDVMFHKSAFSKNAADISEFKYSKLIANAVSGKTDKFKLENTPEKYLEAGAPVIESYKDYCLCLSEIPGYRNYKIQEDV